MFKTSQSLDVTDRARKLYQLIENRKIIEIEERLLKAFFKANFPDGVAVDGYLITTKKCTRTNLDKKQLELDFGDLSEYESETEYLQVDVKKVG